MKKLIYTVFILSIISTVHAQNVGVGTTTPNQKLHLRADSSTLAIRYDNKKSTEGFDLFTSSGLPSSVNQTTFDGRKADWTDFNFSKAQSDNDVYLNSPFIDTSAGVTNTISIGLGFADPLPTDAIVQSIQVNIEWKLQGSESAFVHTYPKLFNGDDYLVNYQRQDIGEMEDQTFQSYGIVIDTALYSSLSVADINAGNLRIEFSNFHEHYLVNDDSVRVRIDEIRLEVAYAVPAPGDENTFWTSGVKEGNFKISNSVDLDAKTFLRIDENGLTRLKELQITKGAGSGKLLTCTEDGIAYWQSPEDLNLDRSETNELQELKIGANKLGIVRVEEQEDTTLRYIHSFVELDSLNYWQKNGLDVYVDTGFVGMGTLNPNAPIHMRQDTQDVYVRFDNRKSAETGTIDSFSVGVPYSVQQYGDVVSLTDWNDFNASDLTESDDVYLQTPQLNGTEAMDGLRIGFQFEEQIPANATINGIKFSVESKHTGQNANDHFHVRGYFLRNSNTGQPARVYLEQGLITIDQTEDEINSGYGATYQGYTSVTVAQLNAGDVEILMTLPYSHFSGNGRLGIDKMNLRVEYTVPATGDENVSWSSGVKNGKFRIANYKNLDSSAYLSINQLGVTSVQALKISEDAGEGKVLTSNNLGRATWQEAPTLFDDDTLNIGALKFDNGQSLLNNSSDMLQTERQWINVLLDTDDDQPNARFALYNNTATSAGFPSVNFNLDGADSWINGGGDVGIGLFDPDVSLHLRHGNDIATSGFKLENSESNTSWKFFAGEAGNMALFSSLVPAINVGSFNGTTGSYTSISDRRMKKNIEPFQKGLSELLQLETTAYHFNVQSGDEQKVVGLIAQDVLPIFPEAVIYEKATDTYKMDYSLFGVLAVKAIQEQQAIILEQKEQIDNFEKRLIAIEKSLNK